MNIEAPHKKLDLSSAIAEGDIRVLLMVLVHMTGDERWLEPPYKPRRDVRLIPDPEAGLPREIQHEIRAAVLKLFADGEPKAAITDPGDELMLKMMRACLGENVAPEYAPLMREEMGFIPRHARWNNRPSGEALWTRNMFLSSAPGSARLRWGWRSAGWASPTPSLRKTPSWAAHGTSTAIPAAGSIRPIIPTRSHSAHGIIGRAISRSARNCWIISRRSRSNMTSAVTSVSTRNWCHRAGTKASAAGISTLQPATARKISSSAVLVSAIGQLNDPSPAHFRGEEDFAGRMFHSALWSNDIKLDGKHVAVIGTGATAMQLVPSIADRVASVTVYQRSAQWARPVAGYSDPIAEGARWLLAHLPFYVQWYRFNMFWRYGDGLLPFLRKDPEWPYPDRAVNKGNDRHRQELTEFILSELKDRSDLIEKCVPTYPPYGKRILLDNGWFRTLTKPNVELVTDPIDHFARDGIVTSGGKLRPADVIVISTGFKVTEMAARLNIAGRDGKSLAEAWADDNPTAYLGLTVPDFPNFFCMLGPNSGPAHGGSVIFQSECQSRYITACLVEMMEHGIAAIDVRQDVHDRYVRDVDAEHAQMIWTHPGMTTYYRNKQGRVFSAMPWRFVDYWAMTHDPDLGQYHHTRA